MNKTQIWEAAPPLKLVVLNQSVRRSGAHFHWHSHSFYELGIVFSGRCDWWLGKRRRVTLQAGEAILVRRNHVHREERPPDHDAELGWLGFDFTGSPPAWSERIIPLSGDFSEITGAFRAIYREHAQVDQQTQLRVRVALHQILLLVARQAGMDLLKPAENAPPTTPTPAKLNSRQIRCVESATYYFRQNLEQALSIAQVAAYHSLCPAHFSTLFRRYHNIAPQSFLLRTRLEKAAALLLGSDLTIKEVASRCGFVDSPHFCKSFKRNQGVSPGGFRKREATPKIRAARSEIGV